MPGIGVVLVDAVPLFRDGVRALLAATPGLRLLGATVEVDAGRELCARVRPDVVLIDAVLDPNGHLALALSSAYPSLAVLCVVREPHRSAEFVARVLAAGAHGAVPSSVAPAQFVAAIRRVHAERRYLDPSLAMLDDRGTAATAPAVRPRLSRREHEVLALIAEGLGNQAVGEALFVSVETVRTHMKSILRKLRARDRAHAVAVAFQTGELTPAPASVEDVAGGRGSQRPPRRESGVRRDVSVGR